MSYRMQDTEASDVGKVLRSYREQQNLSVNELQDFLGFEGTTLFFIETNNDRAISKKVSNVFFTYFQDNEDMKDKLTDALKKQNKRVLSERYEL